MSNFKMEDSSFMLKGLSFSPNYYDDFLQGDVLSSPIAYPQLNWVNDDLFEKKEAGSELLFNFKSYDEILDFIDVNGEKENG